jgi:hypothetical protein
MTDPWVDVRKRLRAFDELKPMSLRLINENSIRDVRCLLSDADALLAVKEAAGDIKREIEEGRPQYVNEGLDILFSRLAALPKHLRGER